MPAADRRIPKMITFKEGNLRIPKWNRRVFVVSGGTTAYKSSLRATNGSVAISLYEYEIDNH
jgi:hypothetical protein